MQKNENEIDDSNKDEIQIDALEKNSIDINGLEKNSPEIVTSCKYCLESINSDAKVCYHCGKYQRKFINGISHFVSLAAIFVVIFSGAQVYVNILQMRETKAKRVEAGKVLEEAKQVLADAINESEKLEKKLS